ncbi:MAG: helix-turn-helix domain-containing protein [Planctomycetaceae bacterium]
MSRETQPREFDFTLVLSGLSAADRDAEEKLFNSGCDDATLSFRSGRPFVTFTRAAASLKDAILSAIEDVKKAGFDVLRVDVCDLVTQSDIARRIGLSRQRVNQYILGLRGPLGFPPPACNITDNHPLWYWCEVAHWLYQNDMIREDVLNEALEVAVINSVLGMKYHKRLAPDLLREMICALVDQGTFLSPPCCP